MIVWLDEAAGFHLQQLAMSKRTSHTKGDKGYDQRDLHTDDENKWRDNNKRSHIYVS